MKLVQFGAGRIGRSFIAQVFSRAGWEVVFVDVDARLVSLLNEKRYYPVLIKREGKADEERRIGPVRAVLAGDTAAAAAETTGADLVVTSVGQRAFPLVLPVIARGLAERQRITPGKPLDIIIAENARGAPDLFRSVLSEELGAAYPLEKLVGLAETSIGKMVPLLGEEELVRDPLLLCAEEYETLIVDRRGFRGPLPDIPALHPVDPIAAYVDRKLFIHNLGHAAAAYLGYRTDPAAGRIEQALALPGVETGVRRAMNEAADALIREFPLQKYPGSYSRQDLSLHIEDLLVRFKNSALRGTTHWVGRDLLRKLSREDRITGAMRLCARHKLPFEGIAQVYRAALEFAAPDEKGRLFPEDARFRSELLPRGRETLLKTVSGLDPADPADKRVMDVLLNEPPFTAA
jgi:mannitol-1-phosphate 5-dehydrogenase